MWACILVESEQLFRLKIAECWILAVLRRQTIFSLAELNRCITHLLVDLNQKPFKHLPGNRQQAFERLDKPALQPLPVNPYTYANIKTFSVNIDCHILFQ